MGAVYELEGAEAWLSFAVREDKGSDVVLCFPFDFPQLDTLLGQALSPGLLSAGRGGEDFGSFDSFANRLCKHVHCVRDVEVHEIQGLCLFFEIALELVLVSVAESWRGGVWTR